eukprot:13064740-Alexandrium_andersonii.AAC.1
MVPQTANGQKPLPSVRQALPTTWTCGMGTPTFADPEPRRGPIGPFGTLGPPPPRTGFWAPSSL